VVQGHGEVRPSVSDALARKYVRQVLRRIGMAVDSRGRVLTQYMEKFIRVFVQQSWGSPSKQRIMWVRRIILAKVNVATYDSLAR